MQRVPKGFKCLACNKVFSQKGNLRAHFLTHTGERPWWCDLDDCGKTFRTKESLRRHKMSHLGIKPFECSECKKKFCSALSLQEHISLHNNSKPYACSDCQRVFRQVSCLRRHMLTHMSDMPHSCDICQRKFSQAIYLRSHMKTHTGEKPYACDQCGKNFAHASDLTRHRVIHTGTKPYACSVCDIAFNDPSSRRRHEREHAEDKSYSCHLCSEGFKRASQLRAHLFRRHGNQKEDAAELEQRGGQMCYRIEVHEGTAAPGTTVKNLTSVDLTDLDLSELERKKILELIDKVQGNIVVRVAGRGIQNIVTETPLDGQEVAVLTDLEVASGDIEQLGMPVDIATVMEEQNDVEDTCEVVQGLEELGHTNAIVQNENGDLHSLQEMGHTYTILQQEAEAGLECEQQVFEVHYHPASSETTITPVCLSAALPPEIMPTNMPITLLQTVSSPTHIPASLASPAPAANLPLTTTVVSMDTAPTGESLSQDDLASNKDSSSGTQDLPSELRADYVSKPNFNSQEYYDWLSSFTEVCKLVPMPLELEVFRKISLVHKTLSDFMATPSGVIADRDNFAILMSISRDLNTILSDHLTCMLNNLS